MSRFREFLKRSGLQLEMPQTDSTQQPEAVGGTERTSNFRRFIQKYGLDIQVPEPYQPNRADKMPTNPDSSIQQIQAQEERKLRQTLISELGQPVSATLKEIHNNIGSGWTSPDVMRNHVRAVSEWLSRTDKMKAQYSGNSSALSYLNAVEALLRDTANNVKSAGAYYGQWESQQKYDNWQKANEHLKNVLISAFGEEKGMKVYENPEARSQMLQAVISKANEDKQSWFKGSNLFDDGYDDFDVLKTAGSTAADAAQEFLEGFLEMGERAVDAGAYLVGQGAQHTGINEQAEKAVADKMRKFVEKDLYDSEKMIKSGAENTPSIPAILKHYGVDDIEDASVLGTKSEGLANSAGQLAGQIGLQAIGVPWYATSGVTSFGGEAEQAFQQGATYNEAGFSAAVAAGSEILTEKLFGGSGLGEKGLINTGKLTSKISNKGVKVLADYGVDIAAEGTEEVVAQFFSTVGQQLSYEKDGTWQELLNDEEKMDAYLRQVADSLFGDEARAEYLDAYAGGAALGGGMNVGNVIGSFQKDADTKKIVAHDYRTGLTAEQQTIFDAEYARRIAEVAPDGKKLSSKQKAEIYDAVLKDVKSGSLSPVDTSGKDAVPAEETEVTAPADSLSTAIESVRSGGTVSNRQAERILSDEQAVNRLVEEAGLELPETMSGRRAAVKQAVVKIAERSADTPESDAKGAETIPAAVEDTVVGDVAVASEGVYEASEDGKTRLKSSGQTVTIQKIASVKNGKMTLQLEDGSKVDASEVEYGSADDAIVYETVASLATNAAAANLMLGTYEGSGVPAQVFAKGMEEAYRYGSVGMAAEQMLDRGSFLDDLTDYQLNTGYELGKMFGGKKTAKEQGKTVAKTDTGSKIKAVRKKGRVKGYGVKMKDLSKAFNTAQEQAYKILCQIADVTGIDIVLFQSKPDVNGNLRGGIIDGIDMNDSQGAFSWKNNKIYIDINAGVLKASDLGDVAKYSMLRTFSHEFTHFLEKHDAQQYNVFRDIVFDVMRRNGVDPDALIEDYMKRHRGTTRGAASCEVVAEAMTDILPESNFIQELAQKHKNIFEKLLDRLKEFVAEIKAHFKSMGGNQSKEAAAVKDYMGDAIRYAEGLVEAFDRLAVSAVENYQTAIFDGGTQNGAEQGKQKETDKGRTDTGVSEAQGGARAETGHGSGISENVGQTGGTRRENPVVERQRRGLTDEPELYGEEDYYTPAEGSPLHMAQDEIQNEYGIKCRVIKTSAWKHDRPARCRNGITYVAEHINADTLATFVSHETTHAMNQYAFEPYLKHVANTPDLLDFETPNAFQLLEMAANHVGIDVFALDDVAQARVYDELNAIVYGFCKGGILANSEYDYGEWVSDAFYDFEGFIKKLDALHEEFKKTRKAENRNAAERQAAETDQFKQWFGDWQNSPENASKVVDADGKPMVMYHGTSSYGFSVFDTYGGKFGLFGKGSYFTDDQSVAESYTQKGNGGQKGVYAVYLNIRNPIDMDADADLDAWRKAFKDASLDPSYLDEVVSNEDAFKALKENLQDDGYVRWEAEEVVTGLIEGMGYDGITHIGGGRYNQNDGTRHRVYIAFESEQIKSAMDNAGTYDGNDPDIYHQDRTETLTNRDIIGEIEGKTELERKTLKEYRETLKHARELARTHADLTRQIDELKAANDPKDRKKLSELTVNAAKTRNRRDIREKQLREMEDGLLAPLIRREKGAVLEKLRNIYGTIPKGEKAVRDDSLPVSVDGKTKVSRTARTVKGAGVTPEDFAELIDTEVVKGGLSYIPISNDEATQRAVEWIKNEGWEAAKIKWSADVRSGKVGAELSARGALLLNNAANAGDKMTWLEILHDYRYMGTNAGQGAQAMRILKQLQPEDKLYMIDRSIEHMVEDMRLGVEITINPEIRELYQNAETYEEENWYLQEIIGEVASQIPSTWMEKWTALRYTMMLGNFKTQNRNIIGNAVMKGVASLKNEVAVGLEQLVYLASGGKFERTKSLTVSGDMLKAAKADFAEVESLILSGGKYNDPQRATTDFINAVRERKTIFKGKFWESYRKTTNWLMNNKYFGDAAFSKSAYARALAGYLKAHGISDSDFSKINQELIDKARLYAIQEAQEATFHDMNALSEAMVRLRYKGPNKVLRVFSLVGEGIQPFRQTVANVLVRAEEYSPLGVVNAAIISAHQAAGKTNLVQLADSQSKIGRAVGKFAQSGQEITGAQIVNSWAKTFTGTGLFILGAILHNTGCLTGGPDDDEKLSDFKELNGYQEYSVKLGDLYFTIDFLSPVAIPMFMGAHFDKELHENGWQWKDIGSTITSITDPMIRMSMLQGVDSALGNIKYSDSNTGQLFLDSVISYFTQGITSSLAGQLERGFESQRMSTYVDKDGQLTPWAQRLLGKASAKTPGWDYNQIPYVNAWGEEEENPDTWLNLAYNMLSPSYISKGEQDAVSQELTRLHEVNETERSVLPSTPKKMIDSFTDSSGVKHTDYNLSADEYVALAKAQGQTQRQIVESMVGSELYEGLPDKYKVKAVHFAYDYAREGAQIQVINRDGFGSKWMAEIEGDTAEGILNHVIAENIEDMYLEGHITADEAIKRRMEYHGDTAEKAAGKIAYWDFKAQKADVHVDDAWLETYYKKVESSGIDIDTYVEYRNQKLGLEKRDEILKVIDAQPISKKQKDALYFAEGYAESTLRKAPWH